MITKELMYEMIEGNPGAMTCLMSLIEHLQDDENKLKELIGLLRDNDIVGTHLYVVWNDACDRDIAKMIWLLENEAVGIELIAELSYHQDRRIGRELEYVMEQYDKTK